MIAPRSGGGLKLGPNPVLRRHAVTKVTLVGLSETRRQWQRQWQRRKSYCLVVDSPKMKTGGHPNLPFFICGCGRFVLLPLNK